MTESLTVWNDFLAQQDKRPPETACLLKARHAARFDLDPGRRFALSYDMHEAFDIGAVRRGNRHA